MNALVMKAAVGRKLAAAGIAGAAGKVLATSKGAVTAFAAASGATQVLIGGAVIGAGYLVYKYRAQIGDALKRVGRLVATVASGVWNGVAGVAGALVGAVMGFAHGAWHAVASAAKSVWRGIKGLFGSKKKRRPARAGNQVRNEHYAAAHGLVTYAGKLQERTMVGFIAQLIAEGKLTGEHTPENIEKMLNLADNVAFIETDETTVDAQVAEVAEATEAAEAMGEKATPPPANRQQRRAADRAAAKVAPHAQKFVQAAQDAAATEAG